MQASSSHDAYAASYDRQVQTYHCYMAEVLFGLCYAELQPGQRLLDAGIGTGLAGQLFAHRGLDVYGFDFSPAMLKLCQAKGFTRGLAQQNILQPWPYPAQSFDLVVCCGVLHFLPDLESVFAEANRVLRPDGLFAFTTKSPPERTSATRFDYQYSGGISIFSHVTAYLESLLQQANFETSKMMRSFVGEDIFSTWVVQKLGNVRSSALHARTQDELVDYLKRDDLPPAERLAASHSLEFLGDLRFDPQHAHLPFSNALALRPEHPDVLGFVHIPAGPFLMGSRPDDPNSSENEYPQHAVTLPDYYLARTPVTVAQFQAFMQEAEPRLGAFPVMKGTHYPVLKVTWFDARQYCAWLTEKLQAWWRLEFSDDPDTLSPGARLFWQRVGDGWQVRLPSEAEWEKAARGPLIPDQAPPLFPWGHARRLDYDLLHRIGVEVAPVDVFPAGHSPYDILGMSSPPCEWTRSLYRPYPYDPGDGREGPYVSGFCAVRGGIREEDMDGDLQEDFRCAVRGALGPYGTYAGIGFRVGLVSPLDAERLAAVTCLDLR